MSQKGRFLLGLVILVAISSVILGLEYFRGQATLPVDPVEVTLTPGSIPIYLDGKLAAGFTPDLMDTLEQVSFVDAEDEKLQDGWLVRDILLTYLPENNLKPATRITITSSSRGKSVELTWAEVDERKNMVMFDLSNKGTVKLVSLLEKLDVREEWIQDVDRMDVVTQ